MNMSKYQRKKDLKQLWQSAGMAARLPGQYRSNLPDAGHRNPQCDTTSLGGRGLPCTVSVRSDRIRWSAVAEINGGANAGIS